MTDSSGQSGKQPVVENPIFKLVVQAAVPVLLGVLVTLAISINATQREQGDKLSAMDGSLKVIVQQNTDFGGRLAKVESRVEENSRTIGGLDGRVLVLENLRHK